MTKRFPTLWQLAGAAALLTSSAAWADSPAIYGPSVARASESATLTGVKFKPNAAVNVVVAAPNGAKAVYSAVTDASGNLSHGFVGAAAGKYRVTVTDTRGRSLASTTVNIVQ